MPRSEFPPVPKSVRLFSVTVDTSLPVPGQARTCMATHSKPRRAGRQMLAWLALGAGVAGVAGGLLLFFADWLGPLESWLRVITNFTNHPGE